MPFVKIEGKEKNQQHCSSQNKSKMYFINDLQKTVDQR